MTDKDVSTEVERLTTKIRNARLDWKLQTDEPCDLLDDMAWALENLRALLSRTRELEQEKDEALRAKWTVVWELLEEFGITRANGCPDSIMREEWQALKTAKEAAEARERELESRIREAADEVRMVSTRLVNSLMTPEKLRAALASPASPAAPMRGRAMLRCFAPGCERLGNGKYCDIHLDYEASPAAPKAGEDR